MDGLRESIAIGFYKLMPYKPLLKRPEWAPGGSSPMQRLALALADAELVRREVQTPCGYSEPESDYRDPDTGAHRTAFCEGGRLVVRGTGEDSVTNGTVFLDARPCPSCVERDYAQPVL